MVGVLTKAFRTPFSGPFLSSSGSVFKGDTLKKGRLKTGLRRVEGAEWATMRDDYCAQSHFSECQVLGGELEVLGLVMVVIPKFMHSFNHQQSTKEAKPARERNDFSLQNPKTRL